MLRPPPQHLLLATRMYDRRGALAAGFFTGVSRIELIELSRMAKYAEQVRVTRLSPALLVFIDKHRPLTNNAAILLLLQPSGGGQRHVRLRGRACDVEELTEANWASKLAEQPYFTVRRGAATASSSRRS